MLIPDAKQAPPSVPPDLSYNLSTDENSVGCDYRFRRTIYTAGYVTLKGPRQRKAGIQSVSDFVSIEMFTQTK